jgi:hypothetical protein
LEIVKKRSLPGRHLGEYVRARKEGGSEFGIGLYPLLGCSSKVVVKPAALGTMALISASKSSLTSSRTLWFPTASFLARPTLAMVLQQLLSGK